MTKLEAIDKREILNESEDRKAAKKSEREVELPSGAKVKATKVQGWQSQKADKEADKEKKKDLDEMTLTSSIAKELLKEFNIAVEEENLDEAGNPWEGKDPAKAAAWAALSPEDQKWLGGADPTDQFILARAPNKGKPAAGGGAATKPATTTAPAAAAPTGIQAQGDDEGNTMITRPDGTTMVVGPDGNAIPPGGGKEKPAASATAAPPAGGAGGDAAVAKTRERMKALLDKLEKTGGVSGAAAAPAAGAAAKPAAKPATGAATKPAAGAPASSQPDWANIGASQMTAEQTLADDQILALIKNI